MPFFRFCTTLISVLSLLYTANSFAIGEDIPLPGDFQPPRQSKIVSKPAPAINNTSKTNEPAARNITPTPLAENKIKTPDTPKPHSQVRHKKQRASDKEATRIHKSAKHGKQLNAKTRSTKISARTHKRSQHSLATKRNNKKHIAQAPRATKQTKKYKASAIQSRKHRASKAHLKQHRAPAHRQKANKAKHKKSSAIKQKTRHHKAKHSR